LEEFDEYLAEKSKAKSKRKVTLSYK